MPVEETPRQPYHGSNGKRPIRCFLILLPPPNSPKLHGYKAKREFGDVEDKTKPDPFLYTAAVTTMLKKKEAQNKRVLLQFLVESQFPTKINSRLDFADKRCRALEIKEIIQNQGKKWDCRRAMTGRREKEKDQEKSNPRMSTKR